MVIQVTVGEQDLEAFHGDMVFRVLLLDESTFAEDSVVVVNEWPTGLWEVKE